MFNEFTFSGTPAGALLAKELEKDGRSSKFVSSVLGKFFKGVKHIVTINDKRVRQSVMVAWRDIHFEKVESCQYLDKYIKSLTYNIIKAKLR